MLQQYRGARSQAEVVAAVQDFGSVPTLSRYENALVEMKPGKVLALLRHYGAPQKAIDEALDCLEQAKRSPDWAPPRGSSDAFHALSAMESRAQTIRAYQETSIPGMLQTRRYALAVLRDYSRNQPDESRRRKLQEDVEERLAFRMRRQLLLEEDNAPTFEAVIAEAVLPVQVGGPLVHRDQLRKLFSMAENNPSIRLRILPSSAKSAGSALHTAMTLIKPHNDGLGRALYLENRNRGGELITDEVEIERYMASLEELWADAKGKNESMNMINFYIGKIRD